MLDIKLFKKNINQLINENSFININISIGNINKNRIMNHKINSRSYDILEGNFLFKLLFAPKISSM